MWGLRVALTVGAAPRELTTAVRLTLSMDSTRMGGMEISTTIESSITRGSPFGRRFALGAVQQLDINIVTATRHTLGPSREK